MTIYNTKNKPTNALYEDLRQSSKSDAIAFCSNYHDHSSDAKEIPAHYHDYIEIIYACEGHFSATINGIEYILHPGDLLLININEAHSYHRYTDCKYYCVQFDPYLLFSTARSSFEARYIMPFIMSFSSPQRVVSAAEIDKTDIPSLIMDFHREYTEKTYGYELAIRADICRIFLWYIRKWENQGLSMSVSSNVKIEDINRLEEVLAYIDAHYMHTVSAEDMAKLCRMSYSYFSRFFKASIGKTFSEYLTYVRLIEAEKRLVSTRQSISQIALDTGFSNASYFITQFKRHRGMTPKKFKQRLLRDSGPFDDDDED